MSKTIVVFEGINGSGKSTQVRLLKEHLEAEGKTCELLQDPGSTPLGVAPRSLLKDRNHEVDPLTQTLLFTAARRALIPVVESSDADVVILDRWWFSTHAYQGSQGVEQGWIRGLGRRCAHLKLRAELCFFLDVDPEIAGRRVDHVRILQGVDRFEAQGLEFQQKVREAYLNLVPPLLTLINCQDLDEHDVAENIWDRVVAHLEGEKS